MDRIEDPPRRKPAPDAPRRGSPLIFLLVLGGVGLFLVLLSPALMKPRAAPSRSLAASAPTTGPVQPSWQRKQAPAAGADAGAP